MLYTRLENLMFFQTFTGMSLTGPSYPPLQGFPGGTVVKNLPANAGDVGSIPESGRSLGKGMTTHSSILAWEMLWTEEPGGLQSTGAQKSRS